MNFEKKQGEEINTLYKILSEDLRHKFWQAGGPGRNTGLEYDLNALNIPLAYLHTSDTTYPAVCYAFGSKDIEELIVGVGLFNNDFWRTKVPHNSIIWVRKPWTVSRYYVNETDVDYKYKAVCRLAIIPEDKVRDCMAQESIDGIYNLGEKNDSKN